MFTSILHALYDDIYIYNSASVWKLASSLGARCETDLRQGITTHVIAAKPTSKVNKARNTPAVYLVNVEWLLECSKCWTRMDERDYPLESLPVLMDEKIPPDIPVLAELIVRKNGVKIVRSNSKGLVPSITDNNNNNNNNNNNDESIFDDLDNNNHTTNNNNNNSNNINPYNFHREDIKGENKRPMKRSRTEEDLDNNNNNNNHTSNNEDKSQQGPSSDEDDDMASLIEEIMS